MFKAIPFFILCCMVLLISAVGAASGGTPPEGNETAATATPIGYADTLSNTVSPNDQFDYYVFTVPEGAVLGGTVRLNSPIYGTLIKLSGPDGEIFQGNTTDNSLPVLFSIPIRPATAGNYYIRIGFWSSGQYNHEYSLTTDIIDYSRLTANGAPWPLERGSVTNSGRSLFKGPVSNIGESKSVDLITLHEKIQQFQGLLKGDEFHSLRVGPAGWVYFTFLFDEPPHFVSLVGYNINTEAEWRYASFDTEICLDYTQWGNGYEWFVCNCTSNLAVGRMSADFAKWPGGCPLTGENYTLTGYPRLLMAGRTICATAEAESAGRKDYHVFSMFDGRSAHPTGGPNLMFDGVFYVCEDNQGDVFARMDNEHVKKFNPDGSEAWEEAETTSELKELSIRPEYFMQPILGSDGCIWVSSIYIAQPERSSPDCYASRYRVLYDGGQANGILKSGDYGPGRIVWKACYGSDSRLYIATDDNVITCYENWNQNVWEAPLVPKPKLPMEMAKASVESQGNAPGGSGTTSGFMHNKAELKLPAGGLTETTPVKDTGYVSEMILDRDNVIYVLRTNWRDTEEDKWCKLYILDPNTGEVLTEKELTLSGNIGPHNWIAIGPDKKLLWMNSAGCLKVYEEKSIQMTAPFREKLSQQK